MKVTNCSMGCMYAEGPIDKCLCTCNGYTHGLMTGQHIAATCSPSVEKRCKAGNEDGACTCACGGVNHGLYKNIEDFDSVPVSTF